MILDFRGITWTRLFGISQVFQRSHIRFREPVTGRELFLLLFLTANRPALGSLVKSYLIQSINLYFELEKNALLLGGSGHQSCNDGYMLLSVIKGKPSKAKDTFFKKLIPLFLHILYNIWNRWVENYTTYLCLININVLIRCLMVSTDQADPHCFYFRISWILMKRHWFCFFHPLHLMQGLRSLKHWLLQKLSMKNFDQKFRFLIKK